MSRLRFLSRGPAGPLGFNSERPLRIDEARFDAWARALGQVRSTADPPRRPHRGLLPDVDLSALEPLPRGPSLPARLWAALWRGSGRKAETTGGLPKAGEAKGRPRLTLVAPVGPAAPPTRAIGKTDRAA